MKEQQAEIGIIGGSGFYDLAEDFREIKVETPYGAPSAMIALGKVGGRQVAFLPRHGKNHEIPPHLINYRANIWALKSLGVERIITSHAVGSLQVDYRPGDLVVVDQFIDRTRGRQDTFYDGPITTHISTAFPYCPQVKDLAVKKAREMRLKCHSGGTMVVVQGPRFSTAAESLWFTQMGWQIISMTGYPEVALAREKEICYTAVGIVTDYDCGLVSEGKAQPVSAEEVIRVFKNNVDKVKKLILAIISHWPTKRACDCGTALAHARF
jgi:5'-methylthioadenosine phosphorylase